MCCGYCSTDLRGLQTIKKGASKNAPFNYLWLSFVYSFSVEMLMYAGRMILPALMSSSSLCALQPAILAVAKSGVYSSQGMSSML